MVLPRFGRSWTVPMTALSTGGRNAYAARESAHRRPGQSIEEWLTYSRKVKLELEAQDQYVVASDKHLASKMLRGAGLPHDDEKAQVLFNCGGIYDPLRMETVLRLSFPMTGDSERKRRLVVPRCQQGSRQGDSSRTVFRRKDDKTRESRKETHVVHECEDV
jgi:hypothetical protein